MLQAAFKGLRLNVEWSKKVRKQLLARAFRALQKGLSLQRIEFNETAEGSKVQLYSRLADSIKDEQDALAVFKHGQSELRQSLNRSVQLSDRLLDFRLSCDSGIPTREQKKLLQSSLALSRDGPLKSLGGENEHEIVQSRLSRCLERDFVPKIDSLRAKLMIKALKQGVTRQLKDSLRAIKVHGEAKKQQQEKDTFRSERRRLAMTKEEADERHATYLKNKAVEAMRGYVARKRDEAVHGMMARKYNFLRRLKIVLRLLRENVAEQQEFR